MSLGWWSTIALLAATLVPLACKTGGSDSELAAWSLDGSEDKAKAFIIATVRSTYPKVAADDPELSRFAAALMDQKVAHSESAAYVLDARAAGGKAELERYIVHEFAASTNIYEVLEGAPGLKYLGPPDQPAAL